MTTRDLVHIALFAALTAALGLFPPLTMPVTGVPVTAQSMGVMLAGALVGARRGGLALVLFVALVAVGLPLMAGGRGGLGVLQGPSGGFVLGFPVAAFVIGWLFDRHRGAPVPVGLAIGYLLLGGVAVLYLIGVPWLAMVGGLPFDKALIGSAVYLPGDLLKAVLTALIARAVRRAYPGL
ncbi:biotin transporter BioY [Paracoccus sp. p4-l81]|uniref:biotin transporter BioY n=1 Tax=Paracoccus sp. p4-l81 TaxID=3342806 RepID=UPI0035BB917A